MWRGCLLPTISYLLSGTWECVYQNDEQVAAYLSDLDSETMSDWGIEGEPGDEIHAALLEFSEQGFVRGTLLNRGEFSAYVQEIERIATDEESPEESEDEAHFRMLAENPVQKYGARLIGHGGWSCPDIQ